MTYEEAIRFWFDQINYEVKSARPSDLKLERMRAFLERLGNPQDRLRIVHITGTKGKGSTAAMLAAIAQQAGYRVGLFTSPHLVQVEERIQVNGQIISQDELAALLTEIAPIVREFGSSEARAITFFEIGTAVGFLHFLRRRVDLAILEVGLGGRFDSTNVCSPLVSVITSIGFDHMAQLGRTLEEIAYQKAGIIKHRVPVVSGVEEAGPREVIAKVAAEQSSRLIQLGRDIRCQHLDSNTTRFLLPGRVVDCSHSLLGEHQGRNAAVTYATVQLLREQGFQFSDRAIAAGFHSPNWPARIEVVRREKPTVIVDSAHNVPSAVALVETLRAAFPNAGRKLCVFSVSNDKQYTDILKILSEYFDEFLLTRYVSNPRSVPTEKLVSLVSKPSRLFATPQEAWRAALEGRGSDQLICITGSVFLAGELRGVASRW